MARRRKEEAEKTRLRIIASALSLFSSKGYEHTTFTDIASRLKLTKGAVYWYFESKECLLVALVELALEKFRRQIEELMPKGELTFPAVAGMMVDDAVQVCEDPKSAAFFRLMHCQIKWGSATMAKVREGLMADIKTGPKFAFLQAIDNDIRAGRARHDIEPEEVTSVCLAIWDGLVKGRIDHFLTCDLKKTLTDAYNAVWESIRLK